MSHTSKSSTKYDGKASNDGRSRQLGMPYATANGRLRKAMMLSLVRQLGLDICIKCGEPITDPAELSIDHIQPWYGVSTDLYWDLTNIGFSHSRCNRRDRGDQLMLRTKCDDGMAWCSRCKAQKPIGEFYKNKTRWNGVGQQCKACHSVTNKASRMRRAGR